ncbi:hypothetical protein VSR01_22405 [Actinacidiphila sp. DG2A-62]|uniref:hypothetical protein n=1 Tax=Actinacidiphila sp. DG2A-62 TaxID=3108821 RepID=UPI002DB6C29C|nr:hypothetical protein [Actinacidiphila sp. DG2A-62]MEC3996118.1 hypothetical protein [Actinacidiphila sp. DG2A-62]
MGAFGAEQLKNGPKTAVADVDAAVTKGLAQRVASEAGQAGGGLAGGVHHLVVFDSAAGPLGQREAAGSGLVEQQSDVQQIPQRFDLGLLLLLQAHEFGDVRAQAVILEAAVGDGLLNAGAQGAVRRVALLGGPFQNGQSAQHDRQDGVGRAVADNLVAEMLQRAAVPVLYQAAGVDSSGGHGIFLRSGQRERVGFV